MSFMKKYFIKSLSKYIFIYINSVLKLINSYDYIILIVY